MRICRKKVSKKPNKRAKYVRSLTDLAALSACFQWLKEKGYTFDVAYTSVLKRAIKTLYSIQQELDLHWIPVYRHWRLNERMYGALQGKNKSETAAKYGEDQVKVSDSNRGSTSSSLSLDLAPGVRYPTAGTRRIK